MVWVVIAIALMLMVSPVLWLKPSPRQRRIVPLRKAAREAGVTVKLEKPPLHGETTAMPGYRWDYPVERPGPRFVLVRDSEASEALKPCLAGWRWRIEPLRPLPQAAQAPLEALLTRLPQDALVLESSEHGITLWWWESQNAERFGTYLDDFRRLRESLAGHPDRPERLRAFGAGPAPTPE
ncbi:preprotein translocase subunit YajC [Halomonas sp. NO4]|uniref:preprotein translocase subunit YajC n=1 Tax=Halomonas sp. NO4 TaxID=2484813 RepID=UPI0013CFC917|nr:preprotein translocase subunit YajC [Halomonas sp. NO4]